MPKRTVRFYIQSGLVDRPEGETKAARYTRAHMDQLLTIKKWQQAGLSLERIGELLAKPGVGVLLLEQNGDGLYTMNLGNLLAGETAEIRFRYAMLLNWNGDTLRVMIPTTLAPRYGVPSGLQPHEVPEHSLMVEYPLDLAVTVAGALANAAVECPSHAVTIERSQEAARLRLETGATLDRDFVLNVRAPTAAASVATAYLWSFLRGHSPAIRCVPLPGL